MELNEIERRILGVLIEKALSQPDYYPLTVNAVRAGSNQRSNRDPVMAISEGDILGVMDDLRRKGLVTMVVREGGRTERWAHNAQTALALDEKELAVLAELLLRGPQTEGELRARASRMRPIESMAEVTGILGRLGDREEPLVERMEREPGRRGIRYRHLLYPAGEVPSPAAATAAVPAVRAEGPGPSELGAVVERLEAVERENAALREAVARLRADVDALRDAIL